ncbi:uncharacterized protein Eint_020805 [Encephalitozoon intestinalis ATCC 50506]|uniref:Uncharacterized protein n=1 Tax=Encephalitozoon intestinalis (strain ATCC 50506) TaxID=876142 RepID=W8PKE0_ENCIT|nr:uncharacterized protein Eint_020805 [Encephalitozoon intestinalis ATCC 50506]AHL30080.1 hypothetical protein Eint_020805 [Encephalitozoon intestinalis ATCC 50506]UTX44732.1 putative lens epithelium-derived growth factor [Encephalitozoon intestinalis]
MHSSLVHLNSLIFSSNLSEVPEAADRCLYDILGQYDHSQMTIFTGLMEILLDTEMSSLASKMLKIVDLIKFPAKKAMV